MHPVQFGLSWVKSTPMPSCTRTKKLVNIRSRLRVVKLTPMHRTLRAVGNGLFTRGDETTVVPYQGLEEMLKDAGYDVLVFLASKEEDESRITCGNAVLLDPGPGGRYDS